MGRPHLMVLEVAADDMTSSWVAENNAPWEGPAPPGRRDHTLDPTGWYGSPDREASNRRPRNRFRAAPDLKAPGAAR